VSLVAVSLGTDHHPFERLVAWAEDWAGRFPTWQLVVQHGRTRGPRNGTGFGFCAREELDALFERADVVLCHGGPGTITQARGFGHRPIVVPRDPQLGEHVDDHQLLFARRLGGAGLITLAETHDAFLAALVGASFLPRQRDPAGARVPPGVHELGRVTEALVARQRSLRTAGTDTQRGR
jgi:UDP-N-acetylglucosamine transferase subunit ALG13